MAGRRGAGVRPHVLCESCRPSSAGISALAGAPANTDDGEYCDGVLAGVSVLLAQSLRLTGAWQPWSSSTWTALLLHTRFGQGWITKQIILVALLLVVLFASRTRGLIIGPKWRDYREYATDLLAGLVRHSLWRRTRS